MNLGLTNRGDYVVRAAICLARAHAAGEVRTLRQVSDEMAVPRTYVPQILRALAHSGLALSSPGVRGGYRLTRPPEDVSLFELIEAGEGSLGFAGCVRRDRTCSGRATCALHETWSEASLVLRSSLERTTLADLVARDLAIEQGAYPVPVDAHRLATAAIATTGTTS